MKSLLASMNSDLSLVARKSLQYQQLIARIMPAELVKQIVFVRLADGCARLTVTNSAFAARIRFHSRDIQQQISRRTPVSRVSIHVLPAGTTLPAPRQSSRDKPRASAKTITAMIQVADSLGEPGSNKPGKPGLQASLRRLAENLAR